MSWSRDEQVRRAAAELRDGNIVNLGIGLPTEVANHIPTGIDVTLHSENGLLGMGPYPYDDEVDPQIINAGKQTVTMLPGASVFDSALSFSMIRGGHVDLAILGGLEVASNGDLANWTVPGKLITGMGGAMDLAAGARRVIVLQSHASKDGKPKLVSQLTLPVTAVGCVARVVTELGVFDCGSDHFTCVERAPGVTTAENHAPHRRSGLVSNLWYRPPMRQAFALLLAIGATPGCIGNDSEPPPLWLQVFTSWKCTAAGRPAWSFSVKRLSESGADHQWSDGTTGATDAASVWETSLYLKHGGAAFRNFEYKVAKSEVLDHLEEWSLTAGGAAPYICDE